MFQACLGTGTVLNEPNKQGLFAWLPVYISNIVMWFQFHFNAGIHVAFQFLSSPPEV